MSAGNWPDPNRAGYPLLPDQSGYHWVKGKADGKVCKIFWNGHSYGPQRRAFAAFFIAEWYDYEGAFLSPAKVNQLLEAEQKRCLAAFSAHGERAELGWNDSTSDEEKQYWRGALNTFEECCDEIRSLGDAP